MLWAFGLLALWAAVSRLAQRRSEARAARLVDAPSPTPWSPLTVHYLVENRHRSRDRGMAAFSEGWFLFEGERTRFALRAVDVHSLAPDGGDLEVALKMERRSMLLKAGREFDRRLAAWYRASEAVAGAPTLPPLG